MKFLIVSITFTSLLCSSLPALEVIDVPFSGASSNFDYSKVKTVSFFFPGNQDLNRMAVIKTASKGKARIVTTGESAIDGEALSPNIATYIFVKSDENNKTTLVTINSFVPGIAIKAVNSEGEKYQGEISIFSDTLVFSDSNTKEIEKAIARRLSDFIYKITSTAKEKPQFFVVH
jgi:hypothetical protein